MKTIIRWGLLVVLAAVVGAGAWFYASLGRPYKGYAEAEQFVDIPPGTGTAGMARRLADAGVVRSDGAFRTAVWLRGSARRLQAGEYRFDRPMTPAEVVDKIARGDVYVRALTFREGLTVREMAAVFENAGFGSAGEFIAASKNAALISDLDPAARDLEGYLFPDTYTLPRRTTAAQLVERMVSRFQNVMTPELRAEAAERGLSIRELVTLASLVEKETARAEERPVVAGVYTNRLKIGMGLQCDPTVIYALMLAGRYDGNIRKGDLQIDSPYNTYRYAGLPPGPIAAPGEASLHAAAKPADVSYLYFVSRNDGSHVFSTTLEEHNRHVYNFQKLRRPSRP
ncbi:MAG TPA: endolytic transglycosylase MltG [Vicinamibacterales bacterium]|nr:endolytic transglycosylase MltG [Vicinamibacterales bacterium]